MSVSAAFNNGSSGRLMDGRGRVMFLSLCLVLQVRLRVCGGGREVVAAVSLYLGSVVG